VGNEAYPAIILLKTGTVESLSLWSDFHRFFLLKCNASKKKPLPDSAENGFLFLHLSIQAYHPQPHHLPLRRCSVSPGCSAFKYTIKLIGANISNYIL
jgi:hypothetical protein